MRKTSILRRTRHLKQQQTPPGKREKAVFSRISLRSLKLWVNGTLDRNRIDDCPNQQGAKRTIRFIPMLVTIA
jgi:hypothetical protein